MPNVNYTKAIKYFIGGSYEKNEIIVRKEYAVKV